MQSIIAKLDVFISHKKFLILTILVFLVIIPGIFYSFHLGNEFRYKDEDSYYNEAKNIAEIHQFSYDGIEPSVFQPPGYSMCLAPFLLLSRSMVPLRIMNYVALGFCVYLIYRLLKDKLSPLSGVLGAILVLCYPVLFYTAGTLYPQTIGSFIFLLILFLLTKEKRTNITFIISGLLFGCLILIIPVFIISLFIVCIWLWWFNKSVDFKCIALTIFFAFIPITAWNIRNYITFKSFIFVSSNSGFMLLLGNSENTTPNAGPNVDIKRYRDEVLRRNLNALEEDSYYRTKAIEWILSHKVQTAKLYFLKFLNNFNYRNNLSTSSESSNAKDIIMLVTYGPLFLLFLCRLILIKRFKPDSREILFIALYFSSALFYAIFFTRIRYRLPFDFLMIYVVAVFITRLIRTSDTEKNVKII
jgi:4-amino-4-deoxy-L-arabinose transferase-like glycosyltransferase